MQSKPDGKYMFVGHVVDHFSKFHVLFPLRSKYAVEVAKNLKVRVFSYFGLPKILHSDNGREFVNDLIKSLLILWPGESNMINGSPGHSQSQGLVEQGNHSVELMISARENDEGTTTWSKWLPEIQCKQWFSPEISAG